MPGDTNYPCNCAPPTPPTTEVEGIGCDPCAVEMPTEICTAADTAALRIAVQVLINWACKINTICFPQKEDLVIIDSYSGNGLVITDYIPDWDGTTVFFNSIEWNGQNIYPTDSTGVRDYTISNGVINFNEHQENCRLAFRVCRCKTLLEMAAETCP